MVWRGVAWHCVVCCDVVQCAVGAVMLAMEFYTVPCSTLLSLLQWPGQCDLDKIWQTTLAF